VEQVRVSRDVKGRKRKENNRMEKKFRDRKNTNSQGWTRKIIAHTSYARNLDPGCVGSREIGQPQG
jgi:hypothetical protein